MHDFSALSPLAYLSTGVLVLFVVAAIWTIILKGFALWYAARNRQKAWFVILLVVNTLGILELIYLVWFRPKTPISNETSAHESSAQA